MSWEWEAGLQVLEGRVRAELEPIGEVSTHTVCKTVHRITVAHASGARVRILVALENPEKGQLLISILRLADPTGKAAYENRTFHRLNAFSPIDFLRDAVQRALDSAIVLLRTYGPVTL